MEEALQFVDLSNYPRDILIEIFMKLDPRLLVNSCMLVSRLWYGILNEDSFWLVRSIRDNCRDVLPPREMIALMNREFCLGKIYIKRPFNRNLIRNQSGEEGFQGWDVSYSGRPMGIVTPYSGNGHRTHGIRTCFSTDFFRSFKDQTIDLDDIGLDPAFLRKFKPTITLSEMYRLFKPHIAGSCDLRVTLESQDPNSETLTIRDSVHHAREINNIFRWIRLTSELRQYVGTVKKITFSDGGSNILIAKASVTISYDFNY